MSKIEKAIQWALAIANDNAHGYDQAGRWGPDYDCSSLVISAWRQAGVPLGSTYTGNMRADMLAHGFVVVTDGSRQAGDVLLNEVHHTAMMVNAAQLVQASINERGTVTGGQTGDQTGREISVAPYYNYPWDCVLRYTAEDAGAAPAASHAEVRGLPTISQADINDVREDVKAVQALLNLRLSTDLEVDGQYGANTDAAVRSAQRRYNLAVDGVCGPQTWAALIFGG